MKLSSITLIMLLSGLQSVRETPGPVYRVSRIDKPVTIDANWEKKVWNQVDALRIQHHMGEKPAHFPVVEAKLAYDAEAIYVIFRVEDRYVRAIRTKHQEGVFRDSCVEFFFSPETHSDNGYFNLEMNCIGTMLFHHQTKPRTGSVHISDEDIAQIQVAHSLPSPVDTEIQEPVTWTVEYRIPFSILEKYHNFNPPVTGTVWRANLYKCADESSHPHWLTWAPVDFPRPNFHLPQFFGQLEFK
jgi:hypothetical protein